MRKIGITGGIGCGKSALAAIIAREGFAVADTDDFTRELWADPAAVERAGRALADRGFLEPDFTPEGVRAAAREAFRDMQALNALETAFHPLIQEKIESWFGRMEREGRQTAFLVVPLLFECGLQYLFDETLTVSTDNGIRERRLQLSRELSAADINLRFNRQWANWAREAYATETLTNNGTPEEFQAKVASYLSRFRNAK